MAGKLRAPDSQFDGHAGGCPRMWMSRRDRGVSFLEQFVPARQSVDVAIRIRKPPVSDAARNLSEFSRLTSGRLRTAARLPSREILPRSPVQARNVCPAGR